MIKDIENPFFDSVKEIWDKGIKMLEFEYKKAVLGYDTSKTPKWLVPKWEVSNQKAFATDLYLLFDEVKANLDECKGLALDRYIFSLLMPFKGLADILHNDNLARMGEVGINKWKPFNEWVFNEIQTVKAPQPQPEQTNNDDGVYCGCVYTMSNLFGVSYIYANMLDAALSERGLDLLNIQKQVGITLLMRRDLTQIGHYLGTPERAKDLISKVAPEPEPPQPQQRQAYNGQTTDAQSLNPEPQQEKPKPTRGRGRPKETFKDKMIDDADGSKLQKIHTKIDGKKGKDAALIILACIKKGWLTKPTYTQVKNEFGDIGCKTGYNNYLNENKFTKEELEGAKNSLD